MTKTTVFLLLSLLVAMSRMAHADGLATDPTNFPDTGTIRCVQVVDYTSPFSDRTNCYILAGEHGEAILIDPADQLEFIPQKQLLANTETGESTLIDSEALGKYQVVTANAMGTPSKVRDAQTKAEFYVYDKFRPTGVGAEQLLQTLTKNKLTLKYIVISHGHLDHFGALTYLKEKTGAEVLMASDALRGVNGAKIAKENLGNIAGYPKDSYRIDGLTTKVDRIIKEGDLISLDGMVLQVIQTPGHSPDGICLRTRQNGKTILFSGDTLLHWGYKLDTRGNYARDEQGNYLTDDTGRTNFTDGSGDQELLYKMIREKLFLLPDDTAVFPGHNEPTTIGVEKKYSPARFAPGEKVIAPVIKEDPLFGAG